MKNKFVAFSCFVVVFSICVTFSLTKVKSEKTDVTTASAKNFYAEKAEDTTSGSLGELVSGVVGGIGDASSGLGDSLGSLGDGSSGLGDALGGSADGSSGLGGIFGGLGDGSSGLGDSIGSIGDSLGGALGGIFGNSANTTSVVITTEDFDSGLIIPVPAATQTIVETTVATTTIVEEEKEGETVDYAATSNPYTKPTGAFAVGDEDETIKWIQWIFIYTGYGLDDDGITGVLDEDTVAVVKKLQHENNLTVDGNITEDVIKAAEVLYYQTILGDDVSAIEVSLEETAGESVSYQTGEADGENDIPVALLVVVLVIIWLLAIGGIVLLFVFKKKKLSAEKNLTEKSGTEKTKTEENKTEISSMSDLFEDADKK